MERKCVVQHSRGGYAEVSSIPSSMGHCSFVLLSVCQILVIANIRHEILLGVRWHVANSPEINYGNKTVIVKDMKLRYKHGIDERSTASKREGTVMNVKTFHWILKEKLFSGFQILPVVHKVPTRKSGPGQDKGPRLCTCWIGSGPFSDYECLMNYPRGSLGTGTMEV